MEIWKLKREKHVGKGRVREKPTLHRETMYATCYLYFQISGNVVSALLSADALHRIKVSKLCEDVENDRKLIFESDFKNT